jgi:hypothetical protein
MGDTGKQPFTRSKHRGAPPYTKTKGLLERRLTGETMAMSGLDTLGDFILPRLRYHYGRFTKPQLYKVAEVYDIQNNVGGDGKLNENELIDKIVLKEWELYIEGKLDEDTKNRIEFQMRAVNVDTDGLNSAELKILDDAKKNIPTYAAGVVPHESLSSGFGRRGYEVSAKMGGGPDSFHDRVKINIETRGKMYDLFILLNDKYNGQLSRRELETKDILALTLVLCYGINFFNNIIEMVGRIERGEEILETSGWTMGDTIDPHRKLEWDKILINTNQEKNEVIDLLSESESEIRRSCGQADISNLFPVVPDLSNLIQEDVAPFSEQLSAILNWGLICHAKSSPASKTLSPSMVEPNIEVNRGVATASLGPLRYASEAAGEVSTSGHPFALLKGELEASDGNIDLVISKLHGNFSDKFINSFVLFSIWNSAIQGLVLARQQSLEIPDRREKTKEGGDGKPTIPVNLDDFLPAYLGIDSDSEAYQILKGTKKYKLNSLWAPAYISGKPPDELIINLKDTIGGFGAAYDKHMAAKMAQVADRVELWEGGREHLEPNYVGYNPVDGFNAKFPSQALQYRIQAMKRTPGATWGPVPGMDVVGAEMGIAEMDVSGGFPGTTGPGDMDTDVELSAFRKKKKKKKKKKPIRTRNRGKHKKPSKRETLAERTMRLRRKKQSRKRKQEKKEKKSKKRNRTNRKKNDRTIRIGDSVEIHYN